MLGYTVVVSKNQLKNITDFKDQVTTAVKVFRYSFSEAIPIFSIALKVVLSLSDRYKIFTSN